MPVSTHKKRQRVKFPLNLSFGEIQNIQAIDRPTETGNFCLSNLEFRNLVSWNPESCALEFHDWNLKFITWSPEPTAWKPESKTSFTLHGNRKENEKNDKGMIAKGSMLLDY